MKKRQRSVKVAQRDKPMLKLVLTLKADHPFWGYRRVWAHLRFVKWGIDMTKVMVESFGWMYIVIVLDWHTKKIVGYYAGLQCRAKHWLEALGMAVNRQFPEGARDQGLNLMAGNGCQATSEAFMQACHNLGIRQAFTSYNNPKGNADTERMMRTMKEELFWLKEWQSPFEVAQALEDWAQQYNKTYLHSALGYKTPERFENECRNSPSTQLAEA